MRGHVLPFLTLAACGGRQKNGDTDSGPVDSAEPPLEVPEDNASNALGDCMGDYRTPEAHPIQLPQCAELQRYTLRDAQAVCNDGTHAVLYVRAVSDPELADVWELHLQGGVCSGWATCAERWCGLGHRDSSKMSSADLPEKIAGLGICDEDAGNLLSGANHAFFYCCSSDGWGGQGSVRYEPPEAGTEVGNGVEIPDGLPAYTMFTHGQHIGTAAIDEPEAGITADGGEALPPLTHRASTTPPTSSSTT